MEPVTHLLTGACLARTGLNRRAAYATLAMALAAEFPDIDTLWSLRGPVSGFEHHRGITHTLVGLPVEAALLLLVFWGIHQWRRRRLAQRSTTGAQAGNLTAVPVRWRILYLFLLLALGSHLLLDYTNNYGIRPFFPFNPRWYAASTVFIFDPLIFLVLVAGLLLPRLFALIAEEVGARHQRFRGAGWARAALVAVVLLWLVRWYEHDKAVVLAETQVIQSPEQPSDDAEIPADASDTSPTPASTGRGILESRRSLANPDPLSIFRWYTASDFGPVYALGTADTWTGTLATGRTLPKPAPGAIPSAAETSHLGRVYLDWSVMPWVTLASDDSDTPTPVPESETTVIFHDLRFMGGPLLLRRGNEPPLTGTVTLGGSGKILDEAMDGRSER